MKMINHFILSVSLFFLSHLVVAQQNVSFDYQVTQIGQGEYEFLISIPEPGNVQFLEIGFLDNAEDDFVSEMFIGSLNKKSDNNFYFFINDNEVQINPGEFIVQITRQEEVQGQELNGSVSIKLMDKDLNILNSYQQVITN